MSGDPVRDDSERVVRIEASGRELREALAPMLKDGHLTVLSAAHYHALREALYKNTFRRAEGTPWPTAALEKGNSTLR